MTIKADRWIKKHSGGQALFNYYYEDTLVHENVPASFFRFPDVIEKLNQLEVGQAYNPDGEFQEVGSGPKTITNVTKIVKVTEGNLITPFIAESQSVITIGDKYYSVPSFGVSSYGYDIRLGKNFKVAVQAIGFDETQSTSNLVVIDPANYNAEDFFVDFENYDYVDLPPKTFALGVSMECVNMPSNMMATCMAKSSVARYGLDASVTPIEPGFKGYITLELYNKTDNPIRLYAGQGIMQLIFHESDERCDVSYADRNGKYQNQPAIPVAAR